jgi:hypothetical protein
MSLAEEIQLPRQLSHVGCKLAGTRLELRLKELEKANLPDDIQRTAAAVIHETGRLDAFSAPLLAMTTIDTCTDNCTAGLEALFGAYVKLYNSQEVEPLSGAQQGRLNAARQLHDGCFPEVDKSRLKFLKYAFPKQWVELSRIQKLLRQPESQAALMLLGCSLEVERFHFWASLYGDRLNKTSPETSQIEAVKSILTSWHTAWRKLTIKVHAFYDEDDNPEHLKIRERLLGPYDEAVSFEREEQRREEQRRLERAKLAKQAEANPEDDAL